MTKLSQKMVKTITRLVVVEFVRIQYLLHYSRNELKEPLLGELH